MFRAREERIVTFKRIALKITTLLSNGSFQCIEDFIELREVM